MDEIVNVNFKDAAKYLCVSTSKLYKMTHKNEILYHKMGRLNVFRLKELDDYLDQHVVLTEDELKKNALAKVVALNKGRLNEDERA